MQSSLGRVNDNDLFKGSIPYETSPNDTELIKLKNFENNDKDEDVVNNPDNFASVCALLKKNYTDRLYWDSPKFSPEIAQVPWISKKKVTLNDLLPSDLQLDESNYESITSKLPSITEADCKITSIRNTNLDNWTTTLPGSIDVKGKLDSEQSEWSNWFNKGSIVSSGIISAKGQCDKAVQSNKQHLVKFYFESNKSYLSANDDKLVVFTQESDIVNLGESRQQWILHPFYPNKVPSYTNTSKPCYLIESNWLRGYFLVPGPFIKPDEVTDLVLVKNPFNVTPAPEEHLASCVPPMNNKDGLILDAYGGFWTFNDTYDSMNVNNAAEVVLPSRDSGERLFAVDSPAKIDTTIPRTLTMSAMKYINKYTNYFSISFIGLCDITSIKKWGANYVVNKDNLPVASIQWDNTSPFKLIVTNKEVTAVDGKTIYDNVYWPGDTYDPEMTMPTGGDVYRWFLRPKNALDTHSFDGVNTCNLTPGINDGYFIFNKKGTYDNTPSNTNHILKTYKPLQYGADNKIDVSDESGIYKLLGKYYEEQNNAYSSRWWNGEDPTTLSVEKEPDYAEFNGRYSSDAKGKSITFPSISDSNHCFNVLKTMQEDKYRDIWVTGDSKNIPMLAEFDGTDKTCTVYNLPSGHITDTSYIHGVGIDGTKLNSSEELATSIDGNNLTLNVFSKKVKKKISDCQYDSINAISSSGGDNTECRTTFLNKDNNKTTLLDLERVKDNLKNCSLGHKVGSDVVTEDTCGKFWAYSDEVSQLLQPWCEYSRYASGDPWKSATEECECLDSKTKPIIDKNEPDNILRDKNGKIVFEKEFLREKLNTEFPKEAEITYDAYCSVDSCGGLFDRYRPKSLDTDAELCPRKTCSILINSYDNSNVQDVKCDIDERSETMTGSGSESESKMYMIIVFIVIALLAAALGIWYIRFKSTGGNTKNNYKNILNNLSMNR